MKNRHTGKISFSIYLSILATLLLWAPAAWSDTTVGGTISTDTTWTLAQSPYIVTSNITVKGTDGADGITTLTLEPGVVVKLNSSRRITIGSSTGDPGALAAQGTFENQIVFTSNQASPAPGDWDYIRIFNTSDDATTVMEHCLVEYGGSTTYGALYLNDAAPRIQYNTFRSNQRSGIYASGSGTSAALINCNTFTQNQNGIIWTGNPAQEMHSNNFNGSTDWGIYYNGSQLLNVEDNWWSDAAGANQSGDSVYGNVDADPWSAQENACIGAVDNQAPHAPSNPTPSDAEVRIATENGLPLTWIGGDPNALDIVSYDLYLGLSATSLQLVSAGLNQIIYTIDPADQGVTYYWQIISKDDKGAETAGPVWHFTTDGDPPDLTINQVTTDPAGNLQSGQSVTFTATVQNSGSGPVVEPFSVDLLIDGTSIGTVVVNQILLAGQTTQVSRAWTYAGGNPTVEVNADNQAQVSETNEENNRYLALLSEVSDTTAPVLVGSSPESAESLQQVQQITATLNDSQGAVDDAAVIASFNVINAAQQSISGSLTESDDTFIFVPASLPLPDDTYQVSLTAADVLGNTHNYTFEFKIDTQPPAKPVITGGTVASGAIQPRPGQNTSDQFMAELTGAREAGTSVWIDDVARVANGDADWTAQISLVPDTNTFEIWLVDKAGNQGESEWVDIEVQPAANINYEYDASGRTSRIYEGQ